MKAQHVRKMLQRLFSDTIVPNLGKHMFVLTKHQPDYLYQGSIFEFQSFLEENIRRIEMHYLP